MRAGSPPHPPFGVEPVGEGGLVERDPLLLGQGDLPTRLVRDHPGVHGRLAQHRGLRGPGGGQSSRAPSQRGLSLAPAPRQQQDGGGRHQPRVGDSRVSPRGGGQALYVRPGSPGGHCPRCPPRCPCSRQGSTRCNMGGSGLPPPVCHRVVLCPKTCPPPGRGAGAAPQGCPQQAQPQPRERVGDKGRCWGRGGGHQGGRARTWCAPGPGGCLSSSRRPRLQGRDTAG